MHLGNFEFVFDGSFSAEESSRVEQVQVLSTDEYLHYNLMFVSFETSRCVYVWCMLVLEVQIPHMGFPKPLPAAVSTGSVSSQWLPRANITSGRINISVWVVKLRKIMVMQDGAFTNIGVHISLSVGYCAQPQSRSPRFLPNRLSLPVTFPSVCADSSRGQGDFCYFSSPSIMRRGKGCAFHKCWDLDSINSSWF